MISNDDGKIWMFGSNDYNESSLIRNKDIGDKIISPYLITDHFAKITNNQHKITNMKLGLRNTFITTTKRKETIDESDMKQVDDDNEKVIFFFLHRIYIM